MSKSPNTKKNIVRNNLISNIKHKDYTRQLSDINEPISYSCMYRKLTQSAFSYIGLKIYCNMLLSDVDNFRWIKSIFHLKFFII